MRRRFFVDEVRNGHAEIAGEEAKHLTRVLRVEAGQRYEISDNRNVFLAEVETARKEQVIFRAIEKLALPAEQASITLLAALIKFDHFEWMIEKATELGVWRILPVVAARSERGLDRAAEKRIERWRRIALESSQQSRRAFLPLIELPQEFSRIVSGEPSEEYSARYALDEMGAEMGAETGDVARLGSAIPGERSVSDSIAVLIGPEGGWTDDERSALVEAKWGRVSLGPLILRAETAAIAALAIVRSAWG